MNDYSSLLASVCQGKTIDLMIELCPDYILEMTKGKREM
jgi:hypothetical protein